MIQGRRARFAADHVMLAEGLVFQGAFLRIIQPARSEAILREADAIYRKHPDYHSVQRMECHEMLGQMLFHRWSFREAEAHYRAALDLCAVLPRSSFIDQPATKALDLAKLGASIMHQGRLAEAEPLLMESIRIYRAQGIPLSRTDIHEPLDALAFLRRAQNQPSAAADLTPERLKASEGNAGRLYKVASDLALCLPMITDNQALGDQSIHILKQAIRAGFRDVRRLRTDPALEPLRTRRDFQGLADDLAFPANPFHRSR
jgi:tetratricopeptide (TPR) repeat protein